MVRIRAFTISLILASACRILASQPQSATWQNTDLDNVFRGGTVINLATSQSPSVVKLRDVVNIPPPKETVLLKVFSRESLPDVLRPVFANPQVRGVTISGRYIAVLKTDFSREYEDIVQHELVHAYITLVSPRELPFWFQEGSAVHFSTDKLRKFYGKPASDQPGVMVGKTSELPEIYKNKLHNFHYLIDKVGKEEFYRWYRQAVITGIVDPRPLLGLTSHTKRMVSSKPVPAWVMVLAGVIVIAVTIVGYCVFRRETQVW